eukprot:409889-Pleurochrysis_carterae.AAC.1
MPCCSRTARASTIPVATDLYELKSTLQSWVPHIAVFIVPRQILFLGDPSRRVHAILIVGAGLDPL